MPVAPRMPQPGPLRGLLAWRKTIGGVRWSGVFAAGVACQGAPSLEPRTPAAPATASTHTPVSALRERSSTGAAAAPTTQASMRRTAAIRAKLDRWARDAMAFWKAHGVDQQYGGMHGALDRTGNSIGPTDKGVIQQARHLWTFSMWYERREATPEVRALADHVYRFLIDHFRDPQDGEFFHRVSREGKPVKRKKQLYAQSFAIYGLAQYAAVFGVAEARDQALACFRSIDARAHDATHLGYDQSQDPGWLRRGAAKGTNTHIHLLESFTTLHRLTQHPLVRARLEELVAVTATKIIQPGGYAHQEFFRDWSPLGQPKVSYGHDIETAWLLLDALDALGRSGDAQVTDTARRLGENAARAGCDRQRGGYFEAGPPGGAPTKLTKVWWVQSEALAGLWALYQLTGNPADLERLEGTLAWIENHQRDPEHGEWYWEIRPDGSFGPQGDAKGGEWKASYHVVRALVFVSDWMGRADRLRPPRG